jgi:hypothetical protein
MTPEDVMAQRARKKRKERIGDVATTLAVYTFLAGVIGLALLASYYEAKRDLWLWRQWWAEEGP